MSYYILTNAANEKEVGRYPQTKGLPEGYTVKWFENIRSMTKLSNNFFPEENPELIFELEKKAKLTDVVSVSNISSTGLLLNERVKKILENYNLAEHKYYPAILHVNKQKEKYYWLHFVKNNLNDIDCDLTKFYLSEFGFDKIRNIQITSLQDAINITNETDYFVKIERLVLKKEFQMLDLFYLPTPNRLFISKNLKENLTGVSGITIEELLK